MSSHFLHLLLGHYQQLVVSETNLNGMLAVEQCGCEEFSVSWLQVLFYLLVLSQLKYKQIMQRGHAVAQNLNEDFHS